MKLDMNDPRNLNPHFCFKSTMGMSRKRARKAYDYRLEGFEFHPVFTFDPKGAKS